MAPLEPESFSEAGRRCDPLSADGVEGGMRCAHTTAMTRFRAILFDPRVWRIASILLTLVLVACQESDGGGGGGGGAPGY